MGYDTKDQIFAPPSWPNARKWCGSERTQPKVSSLLRSEFSNFSERKLMDCLNRFGYDIEIRVCETAEPIGHLVLTHA